MLTSTVALLRAAGEGGYAVGAFNIYNLEGVRKDDNHCTVWGWRENRHPHRQRAQE
jgi:hypothetical protein